MPDYDNLLSIISFPKSIKLFTKYGMNEHEVFNLIKDKMMHEAKGIKRSFQDSVRNWRHDVSFNVDIGIDYSLGAVVMDIYTDDPIYYFLDRGTRVRYATMDREFRSKTKPGRIRSGMGAGNPDPIYVNRGVPRPGIEARRFTDMIYKRRIGKFQDAMRQVSNDIFNDFMRSWKR